MFFKISDYKHWWSTWRSLPVGDWVRAAKHFKNGNFSAAAKAYARGIKFRPYHPTVYCARLDLAFCLIQQGKFTEAEAAMKSVVMSLPKSREAHIRLAKLQLWLAKPVEAAWTLRRLLRSHDPDPDIIGYLLFALVENEGPSSLLADAEEHAKSLLEDGKSSDFLDSMILYAAYLKGNNRIAAIEGLERASKKPSASLSTLIASASVLLDERKIALARSVLRKAIALDSNHPRVLSLFAETYLRSGPFYNSEYALQLATNACQQTGWSSPRELHVLAEVYFHLDDRLGALVAAKKAQQEGEKLLGKYRDANELERLIASLSTRH